MIQPSWRRWRKLEWEGYLFYIFLFWVCGLPLFPKIFHISSLRPHLSQLYWYVYIISLFYRVFATNCDQCGIKGFENRNKWLVSGVCITCGFNYLQHIFLINHSRDNRLVGQQDQSPSREAERDITKMTPVQFAIAALKINLSSPRKRAHNSAGPVADLRRPKGGRADERDDAVGPPISSSVLQRTPRAGGS